MFSQRDFTPDEGFWRGDQGTIPRIGDTSFGLELRCTFPSGSNIRQMEAAGVEDTVGA